MDKGGPNLQVSDCIHILNCRANESIYPCLMVAKNETHIFYGDGFDMDTIVVSWALSLQCFGDCFQTSNVMLTFVLFWSKSIL